MTLNLRQKYPISRTWQGLVTVLSMAWRKALFLVESFSMSKYEVVAKSGFRELSETCSSSSMTTHSELPVSGSSLSWKTRWVDPELMARVAVVFNRVNDREVWEWMERMRISVLGIRETMKIGSGTCLRSDGQRRFRWSVFSVSF